VRDDDDDDDRRRHDAPAPKTVAAQPGVLTQPEPAIGSIPLVGATGVKGEHIEDGERDPGTIAEEQRRRSAALEAGASMAEVATTDLPDPSHVSESRRVAPPPIQHQPTHKDDHHTTKK